MTKPLISVISIIYKVEPYLRQCLESLEKLTYPNLELILVVGQSGKGPDTDDNCLQIAEEFVSKDPRFKILTCIASGVSDARNRGLDAAGGEYIGFVDGDDFVDPGMYDRLYDNMVSYDADISVCGKYEEYADGAYGVESSGSRAAGEKREPELLSSKEAAGMLIGGSGFFFHSWDKLFKAELFAGKRFPEDKYLEDRYTIGDIILKAERIVYDRTPFYHFRVRTDSVSHHKRMSEMNSDADTVFVSKVLTRYPELYDEAENYLLYGHITCIQNALVSGEFRKEEEKRHFDYIREHRKSTRTNIYVNLNTRVKAFLSLHSLFLLKLVTLWGKRKQGGSRAFTIKQESNEA